MQQRVRESYRGITSFVCLQLPIRAALHAGSPTLFQDTIHDARKNVKHFSAVLEANFSFFLKDSQKVHKKSQIISVLFSFASEACDILMLKSQ